LGAAVGAGGRALPAVICLQLSTDLNEKGQFAICSWPSYKIRRSARGAPV
jgi:hypothetical protein